MVRVLTAKHPGPDTPDEQLPDTSRIFFALWPEQSVRTAISGISRQLPERQGRLVVPNNLHITLGFIGEVDRQKVPAFIEAAEAVKAKTVTLVLDHLGYFARSRVVWLGCTAIPAALQELVRQLNSALRKTGYRPGRRPFQAHITLFRNAKPLTELPQFTPVNWRINGFVLVESVLQPSGPLYRIIKEYHCAG